MKICIPFLVFGALVSSGAIAQNYKVTARVGDDSNGKICYLYNVDKDANIDSAKVKKGVATFSGHIDGTAKVHLMIDEKSHGDFFLENTKINYDPDGGWPQGGELNKKLGDYWTARLDKTGKFNTLPDSLQKLHYNEVRAEIAELERRLMEDNMDNALGVDEFIRANRYDNIADIEAAMAKYPSLQGNARLLKQIKALRTEQETAEGQMFKDFEVTYEGETFRLSDVVGKGKPVLVDFWASWCGPCIKQTKIIKGLYEQYKDKGLEVVGVAVWDEPEATKRGIVQHKLPWRNVINAQHIPSDIYGFQGIPCIILFGPDGKILSRDKQDDELVDDVRDAMGDPAPIGGPFTLSGSIEGLPDSIRVALYNVEREQRVKIAETFPKDGRFEIKAEVPGITLCQLAFGKYVPKNEAYSNVFSLKMMAGDGDINISTDRTYGQLANGDRAQDVIDVKGGKAQRQYREFLWNIRKEAAAERKASSASTNKWFETYNNPDTMKIYEAAEAAAKAELAKAKMRFFKAHPSYHISAQEIGTQLIDIFTHSADELREMAALVQSCPDTARISNIQRRLDYGLKYALNKEYDDFAVTTDAKKVKKFSDYVAPGKYTFIDFWASWCGPCREAIPHVKELHKTYGDRMNVLSISVDENEKAWRTAMKKENMDWTQLWLANSDQNKDAATAYCLTSIPRLILLDPQGRVVCSTFKPDVIDEYLKNNLK